MAAIQCISLITGTGTPTKDILITFLNLVPRQQEVIEQKQTRLDDMARELEASREDGRQLEDRLHQLEEELADQRVDHEAALAELTKANSLNSQLTAVLKILDSPHSSSSSGREGGAPGPPALEQLITEVTQCNNFISRLQDKVQSLEANLERRDLEVEQLTAQLTLAQAANDSGALSASDSNPTAASPSSGELPGGLWDEEEPPGSLADFAKKAQDNDDTVKYQFLKRSVYYFLTDKENREYHLQCIQRLLQFTEGEKQVIDRHRPLKRY